MPSKIVVAPPAGAAPTTNVAELSVSELSNALKRTVEDRFGFVRVRGEISNFRGRHSSGHAYFSLKDAGARLDAVVWKGSFAKLKAKPEEGLEVIATGRITTFPGKSAYQIVIEAMEPAGVGALMALLEERRKTLLAEGLFEAARKKPLPFLPGVIGVVTSPTGAVIRDILHRLNDRFPRHVILWPVRVQGETAAAEVAAAIAGFDALGAGSALPRPDVLIVARGGGSLEDLWSFNEESVVRAAAACAIPIISAVGHETDTTLIDFVADLRAPTPTGAAEKCVPVRTDLIAQIADLTNRRHNARRRWFERAASELRSLARALPTRDGVLALPRQRTDRAGERLDAAMRRGLANNRARLAAAERGLARHTPVAELRASQGRFRALSDRFDRITQTGIVPPRREAAATLRARLLRATEARTRAKLDGLRLAINALDTRRMRALHGIVETRRASLEREWKLIESLGYRNVLARGFALVRSRKDNEPIKLAVDVKPVMPLTLEFADGAIEVRAEGTAQPVRRKTASGGQGSLF